MHPCCLPTMRLSDDTAVNFDWDDVSGATYYQLNIFDYDFNRLYTFYSTEIGGSPPVSAYSLPAGFLEAGRLYRWRVLPRREYYDDNVDNGGSIPSSTWDSPVFATSIPVDRDGDGIPDYWEELHGLDPADSDDGNADADGDELSNYDEFQIDYGSSSPGYG